MTSIADHLAFAAPPTGNDILKQFGFDNKGSIEQNCGVLFAIMWGFLTMAYIMLWVNVRRLVNS